MIPIRLAGTGSYVPEKVLTNFDLEKILNTSDEWIVKRTGIRERRIAADEQATSHLAAEACQKAFEASGVSPRDIDLIIMATITPDNQCPCGANCLQAKLDCPQAISFDVTAACSGFIFVMDVGRRYIQSGAAKNVLIVAAEVMSRVQDWTDRANCVLWGDGAGAAILQASEEGPQLLTTYIGSDGANGQDLLVPGGGSAVTPITHESVDAKLHTLKMLNGPKRLKTAVHYFCESVHKVLAETGRTIDEIDHFIPHQANIRINQQVAKHLGVGMDRFFMTIEKYANISSASCAIALDEAVRTGRIKKGDLVCMPVFGGGLTWGASLIQF